MTWQTPWVTAGVDEIPLDVARAFAYVSTGGREGVVGHGDLFVSQTATPSGSISVATGAFVTISRFLGAAFESYIGRNVGSPSIATVPNTGATSRTDLVYAHITDPGQAGQPSTPAPVETRVITGVSSGVTRLQDVSGYENQSGYALARITRPANATTVVNAQITDLRALIEDSSAPTGKVDMFAGMTAPTNWLFCNGQAVSRTSYPRLFAVISTLWGAGNGTTTFNVPNFSGRMPIGLGLATGVNGATTHTIGQQGGHETVTLTASQIPAHNHTASGSTGTAGSHVHAADFTSTAYPGGVAANAIPFAGSPVTHPGYTASYMSAAGDHTHTVSVTVDNSTGGGGSHDNMSPYLGINFIIKAT